MTTMGGVEAKRGITDLIRDLANREWSEREAAAEALGKVGAPAIEPLIAVLASDDNSHWNSAEYLWAREAAVVALGKVGEPAVKPLLAALEYHFEKGRIWSVKSNQIRMGAIKALGETGSTEAVKPLIALFVRRDQISLKEGNNAHTQSEIAEALGKIGDPTAIESLLKEIRTSHCGLDKAVVHALGDLGDPAVVGDLLKTLESPDQDLQVESAEALGKIGDSAAIKPLASKLKDGDKGRLAATAAKALGEIGDPAAIKPLVKTLTSKNAGTLVRQSAADALGKIGDPAAAKPLLKTLSDGEQSVRDAAWHALRKLGIDPPHSSS